MKNRFVYFVIIMLLLFLPIISAQLSNRDSQLLNEYGVSFDNTNKIQVDRASGDLIISSGANVDVTGDKFNGKIRGGSGGGRVVVNKQPITLTQGGYVVIKNGKIVEFKNANLEKAIVLNGHSFQGTGVDYDGNKITTSSRVVIDGVTYENLISAQPIDILFMADGTVRVQPKSVTATVRIDGKKIIFGKDAKGRKSWIALRGKEIVGFNGIEAVDYISFLGREIKGKDLSYDYTSDKILRFREIFIDDKFHFFAPNIAPLSFQKNLFNIDASESFVYQLDVFNNKRKKRFENGKFLFDENEPLKLNYLSDRVSFTDYERNIRARINGGAKETTYYSGGSIQDDFCGSVKGSCLDLTREGAFNGQVSGNSKIQLRQMRRLGFPFKSINAKRITDKGASLSIFGDTQNKYGRLKDFELSLDSKGYSISRVGDELPPNLKAIILELPNGGKIVNTREGTFRNEIKIASFEKELLSELLAEYEQQGSLRKDINKNYLALKGIVKDIKDPKIGKLIVSKCQNPFYGCNFRNMPALAKFLGRIKEEDAGRYKFLEKYLLGGANRQLSHLEQLNNIYALFPTTQTKELFLLNIHPLQIDDLNFLPPDLYENEERLDALYSLQQVVKFRSIKPLMDMNLFLNKHDIGLVNNVENYYKFYYSVLDSEYETLDTIYPIERLRNMYGLYTTFFGSYFSRSGAVFTYDIYMKALKNNNVKVLDALDAASKNPELSSFLFEGKVKFREDAEGLLYPHKDDGPLKFKDASQLNTFIDYLTKTDFGEDSKGIASQVEGYLASQSQRLFYYVNGLHNNPILRKKLVSNIPTEIYFYSIARSKGKIGTSRGQLYPSSYQMIVDTYKGKTGDILKHAQSKSNNQLFSDFRYSLVSSQELAKHLDDTDPSTRQFYTESFIQDLTSNRRPSQTMESAQALSHILDKSKDGQFLSSVKENLMSLYRLDADSKSPHIDPIIQFLVTKHQSEFTEEELKFFDPGYSNGQFPNFGPKIKNILESVSYVPIRDMMVERNGRNVIRGAAFFGSLGDKNEQPHFNNFVAHLRSSGFKVEKRSESVSYDGVPIHYYTLIKDIPVINYRDEDGKLQTARNVRIDFSIIPRKPTSRDILQPLSVFRGHVGVSGNLENMLPSRDHPIYANLGGCFEGRLIAEKVSGIPDLDFRLTGTTGTGRGAINNLLTSGMIASIERGITNSEEQQKFISNWVNKGLEGYKDKSLKKDFEKYQFPNEYMWSQVQGVAFGSS